MICPTDTKFFVIVGMSSTLISFPLYPTWLTGTSLTCSIQCGESSPVSTTPHCFSFSIYENQKCHVACHVVRRSRVNVPHFFQSKSGLLPRVHLVFHHKGWPYFVLPVLDPSNPFGCCELCRLPCVVLLDLDLSILAHFFQHSLSLWPFLPQYQHFVSAFPCGFLAPL